MSTSKTLDKIKILALPNQSIEIFYDSYNFAIFSAV